MGGAGKRIIIVAVLACMLAGAWGQDHLDVTDEGHFVPGNPPVLVPGWYFATWVPYLNGERISEADFYRIVGRDEMATHAEVWLRKKEVLGWGGLAVIGTGLAAALAEGLVMGHAAGDAPFYTSTAALTLGSSLWIGYLAMGFNFRPFDEARGMAEDFNAAQTAK